MLNDPRNYFSMSDVPPKHLKANRDSNVFIKEAASDRMVHANKPTAKITLFFVNIDYMEYIHVLKGL